jgi:hypothetical protein
MSDDSIVGEEVANFSDDFNKPLLDLGHSGGQ